MTENFTSISCYQPNVNIITFVYSDVFQIFINHISRNESNPIMGIKMFVNYDDWIKRNGNYIIWGVGGSTNIS